MFAGLGDNFARYFKQLHNKIMGRVSINVINYTCNTNDPFVIVTDESITGWYFIKYL